MLVFDLCGGTFDIAILTIFNWNIDVKTYGADMHLDGEDFDNLRVEHVMEKVEAQAGRDLLMDKSSADPEIRTKANNFIRQLKMECEKNKRALSSVEGVRIVLQEAGWTVDAKMTRNEFEELVNPQLKKCIDIVEGALKDAKISANDIHDMTLCLWEAPRKSQKFSRCSKNVSRECS